MLENDELEQETPEMDADDVITVHDLVVNAMDEKPMEFKQNFSDLLASRIRDAVAERKFEIAQGAVAPEGEEEFAPEDDISDDNFEDDPEEHEETPEE